MYYLLYRRDGTKDPYCPPSLRDTLKWWLDNFWLCELEKCAIITTYLTNDHFKDFFIKDWLDLIHHNSFSTKFVTKCKFCSFTILKDFKTLLHPKNALNFCFHFFWWLSGSRWITVFLYHFLAILAFLLYFLVRNRHHW